MQTKIKSQEVAITNLYDIKEHNHTEHDRFEILNNHQLVGLISIEQEESIEMQVLLISTSEYAQSCIKKNLNRNRNRGNGWMSLAGRGH